MNVILLGFYPTVYIVTYVTMRFLLDQTSRKTSEP